jgi:flagellin
MSLFSINTNIGALAALQSLDQTQQALTTAQNEVSTGQSVSTAADNPAIYSIANTINANIAGLSAVSNSLNFGAQIVTTASNGIASINSVLASLQQTVTSSGQTGINTTTLQAAVTADITAINEYASQATFNGVNLLDPATQTGISSSLNVVQGLDGSVYTVDNQGTAIAGQNPTTSLASALGISGLNVTTTGQQVTFSNALALNSFSSSVTTNGSADIATSGDGPQAGQNAAFQITTGTGGSAETYSFEFVDSQASTAALLTPASSTTHIIQVNIDTATESTNQIVGDLVNSIRNTGFTVAQNTDGSLTITGSDPTSGKSIASADFGVVGSTSGSASAPVVGDFVSTAGSSTSGVTVAASTNTQLTTALVTTVQTAITSANTISATLGAASDQIAGLQSFTSSLSSALTAGVGALTDADLAAESAQLTSLQTKQQLATQSLSIANKQPQSLLTLFQGL